GYGSSGSYVVTFKATANGLTDSETITITVKDQSTDTGESSGSSSSGSSGGGGGGGSLTTGESYKNIEFKDYAIRSVVRDMETVFSFGKESNNIISVSFRSGLNFGQVKAVVEMLKDTSALVSAAPPGIVYKNLNIWVGGGTILPKHISDAKIVFRVDREWIDSNDVDPDSIVLSRYNGSAWEQLPTSISNESEEYFSYVAETSGFSPFLISSVSEETANVEESDEKTGSSSKMQDIQNSVADMTASENNAATQDESPTGSHIFTLVLLGVIVVGMLGYNKREYFEQYYQKLRAVYGNYDGKRYRRKR
ncbi:MAG: PGF-pre-PGF domain-containing protein, partial [Methanosarcinaceae archaeon]|nr:PGF-pre-PGF domain-containing protein [Methanosarcinaceae archaeon]